MFHSSLTLILVEQIHPIDEHVYFDKIEILFNALVFMYGLDDLIEINSIEKFKNEIKVNQFKKIGKNYHNFLYQIFRLRIIWWMPY